MSEHRTMNPDRLRDVLTAMSRNELERFAASAQLALDEIQHKYQRTESELVRLQGRSARTTWSATDPDATRTYHFHMTIAFYKDAKTAHKPVPVPDMHGDVVHIVVPGTERRYFHAGTITISPGTNAADIYRQKFHKICNDLNLSETERSTVTVLSWNLIRDEF